MDSLKEMLKFLQLGARLDLKAVSVEHVLSLTGNSESVDLIIQLPQLLQSLLILTNDSTITIAKDAYLALVNISAEEKGARELIHLKIDESSFIQLAPKNIVVTCLQAIVHPESDFADFACMILSNLTRPSSLIDEVIFMIENSNITLEKLVSVFTKIGYNKKGAHLHYLGPVFSNLSQSVTVRKYLMDKEKCVIQKLLPFTEYKESVVRRGGIVGTLKNCCFDSENHSWLLSEEVNILPQLLLPLAGNEEFDEDDNDKLPIDLQYLPENKTREPDPDIRAILLEALTQLCAKRDNREFIRNHNAYVILRELHKWEKDRTALLACENLVDILIKTEDEIGLDDLKQVEVPEEYQEKFTKMDEEFINEKS